MKLIIALALGSVTLNVLSAALRKSGSVAEGSELKEPVGVFNYLANSNDDKTMARSHKELLEDIKQKLINVSEEDDIEYLSRVAGQIEAVKAAAAAEPKKTRKPSVKDEDQTETEEA